MPDDKERLAQQIFEAKWIANGFPKSGTHLLVRTLLPIAPLASPTEAGYFKQPWAGTFKDNSWSLRRQPIKQTTFRIGRVGNGKMIKAHIGYDNEIANFIDHLGAMHILIYRDLRDVAVSQAYHILNAEDSDHLEHPHPEAYDRENFDELLLQVITGHSDYPGLIERWEAFAPWLDDPWTYCVKFEDMIAEPHLWTKRIWSQAMHKMGQRFGVNISFDPDGANTVVELMVYSAKQRQLSPTFRKGVSGEWRQEFTERHIQMFNERGGAEWLIKLGYERDHQWMTKT